LKNLNEEEKILINCLLELIQELYKCKHHKQLSSKSSLDLDAL